jgi:integrase
VGPVGLGTSARAFLERHFRTFCRPATRVCSLTPTIFKSIAAALAFTENDRFGQSTLAQPLWSKANRRSDSTCPITILAKRKRNPPVRQPNDASRSHEYLTPDEVEHMIAVARRAGGRLAERDALLIMMAYRHGFRAHHCGGTG